MPIEWHEDKKRRGKSGTERRSIREEKKIRYRVSPARIASIKKLHEGDPEKKEELLAKAREQEARNLRGHPGRPKLSASNKESAI